MALHRAGTPGQGNPGSDGVIVVAASLRTPLQGREGTLCRPGQPGVQLGRLSLTPELRKVLGSGDGGGDLRRLSLQLGELSGLIIILPRWSPPPQPGRPTRGELAG
jgi:hypothetical protein